MNMAQVTAAVCEIKLENGDNCGVTAIGRCATCGHAFCPTHQAWSGRTFFINQCAPCFAESPAEVERVKKAKRDREIATAAQYLEGYSARGDLLTSGVQPVDIHWPTQKGKRGFFGYRYVDVIAHGRGWIIGEFLWQFRELPKYDRRSNTEETKPVVKSWMTALIDVEPYGVKPQYWAKLVRVHRVPEGYEALNFFRDDQIVDHDELIKVAQAIKRLTGASS